VLDLLIYLVQNRDRVVSKDDLIASVWGGWIVSDATLTSRIYAARKAVGDSGQDQKLIRTIARKGSRFVGAVRQSDGDELAHATGPLSDELRKPLPLPDQPSIAVLPFQNMSGELEQDYKASVSGFETYILAKLEDHEEEYFIAMLMIVAVTGALAQSINLPGIVGAFLAGLAINVAAHAKSARRNWSSSATPSSSRPSSS
jgi:DNA-binding winged helix-turn-helix (wHTH) protein